MPKEEILAWILRDLQYLGDTRLPIVGSPMTREGLYGVGSLG